MSVTNLSPTDLRVNAARRRSTADLSIAQYLIQRFLDYGIGHMFGIPGDYVLSLYSELERSPIQMVGCTREDCAGFAADAYARLNGMGAVCVTYCVGGLSVCNSIAGAFAEKSPVVVLTGSPGKEERSRGALLHHMVRDFRTQFEVFEKFTIAGSELSDPLTAFSEIDRVLDACDRFKRPVYLELPRDMVHVVPPIAHGYHRVVQEPSTGATEEAITETRQRLEQAKQPVILAGVELHRFGLQDRVLKLAETAAIPIATTMLGKSVISERHPNFIGLYEGALGDARVTDFVESSDLVLVLGAFLSDINLGIFSANLEPRRCVYATSEELRISHHHYHHVNLGEYLAGISAPGLNRGLRSRPPISLAQTSPLDSWSPNPDAAIDSDQTRPPVHGDASDERLIRTSWMMTRLNRLIDAETIVIADVGDSLFAATELVIHERGEFLSPAYYTSMGFSVPAALGAATARPNHRVVVLVGDGAFQMTGQELSTLLRYGHHPLIIVLDNRGYGTERYLHAGDWQFNTVQPWEYGKLLEVFGAGQAHRVQKEAEFETALVQGWDDSDHAHLIHVDLDPGDGSDTLKKLAERMSHHVG